MKGSPTHSVCFELKLSIIHPIENFEKYKIKPPTGFILHGQSGIGKSEFIKYIIERLGLIDSANVFRCETRDQLDHIFMQIDKIKSKPALGKNSKNKRRVPSSKSPRNHKNSLKISVLDLSNFEF